MTRVARAYVVQLTEQDRVTGVEPHVRYLQAIAYRTYSDAGEAYRCTVDKPDEAFVFTERAAAELAAVWVGGRVLELDADGFLKLAYADLNT